MKSSVGGPVGMVITVGMGSVVVGGSAVGGAEMGVMAMWLLSGWSGRDRT